MTQSRFRLTANPDSKAERQKQTTKHPGVQQREERSAWRTPVNASKQALASPPFGTPRFSPSINVRFKLKTPIRRLLRSTKIRSCLPVLGSPATYVKALAYPAQRADEPALTELRHF